MRHSKKSRSVYQDSRSRINNIQKSFSLTDAELTEIMMVSPQTTSNWVHGYSHTGRSMRIHRQRIDLLERASRNPYENAVIATALSQGGVGGLSALLMYCISGGTSLEKAVNTRQFMWVRYYLAKDFRNNVQAGFSPDKAYKMTSCQMAIARLENSKKRYGRK